jgi:hypothetical protein
MAVGTASAIIGGLGMAKGIYDTIDASDRKKKHQAELDNYQRQDLENVVRNNVQISTIGSDYMAEENARGTATAMQGVQGGGARAIIGATQGVVNQNNQANREGRQYLDDQVIKRDYAIAEDDATIRGMQEQREYQDLAGTGNAINTANQDFNTGLTGAMNSAMYLGSNLGGGTKSVNESVETDINGNPIPKNMRGMTVKSSAGEAMPIPENTINPRIPIDSSNIMRGVFNPQTSSITPSGISDKVQMEQHSLYGLPNTRPRVNPSYQYFN